MKNEFPSGHAYLDCYIFPNDMEGHPTATYACQNWDEAFTAKRHAEKHFSRVDIKPASDGLSPQRIPEEWK